MQETRELAHFITSLRYESLPLEVISRAKESILDQIGIQLGVAHKPWLRIAYDYVMGLGGKEEATIACYGNRTSVENAAFVNGTFGHGFEMDDVYSLALAHPGPVIVPAALAVGEREHISGKDLILAVIVGYEVMGRVGHALSPTHLYRGFHPTSVAGSIGSAASVGKILRFDPDIMVHALAISASFSSGLVECYKSGGEVKRYHAGIASSGGIRAAHLAKIGLTGPSTILEGPLGIKAFSDSFTPEVISEKLGQFFVVNNIWLKKYSCNGMIHAPLDAVEEIRAKNEINLNDIEEVIVGSNFQAINEVGSIRSPKDIFGFQFSINYALALQLVKRSNDFSDYTEANMKDPMIVNLAKKIRIEGDSYIDSLFPDKIGGKVSIKMKDGKVFTETIENCRGTPMNPMDREERERKVRNVAKMTTSSNQINRIIEVVNNLETINDIEEFTALLKSKGDL